MKTPAAVTPIAQPVLTGLPNEVRAKLMAETGINIAADDPLMLVVTLNQILLPKIALDVARIITEANAATAEQLATMRRETLKATAADLGLLAGEARFNLTLNLTKAQAQVQTLIASIQVSLSNTRWYWIGIGVLWALGFGTGAFLGVRYGLR